MEAKSSAKDPRFVNLAGLRRVYEPEGNDCPEAKKYPCKDCHFCQFCSDARCQSCRSKRGGTGGASGCKLSIKEQIALFEQLNRKA
jgi:hypothetical protein